MVGRGLLSRAEPGFTMPAFERLAPPPPPDLVVARLEAATAPGDIVADLHGRGGWIARAAIDRQRRAISLETSPLTRLLAEIVLRPPDLRHLDAAFSTLSASPRGESSLKLSIGAMFATRCATCERSLVADEFTWSAGRGDSTGMEPRNRIQPVGDQGVLGEIAVLVRKSYRCSICRDQRGGLEQRQAPADDADRARAAADVGLTAMRPSLRERFPMPEGAASLADAILDLHTDRQLVGLAAILERIEGDLRAAPVESALRLAFLHTVLPASRLGTGPGRMQGIRIGGGVIRSPVPDSFRERNPWLAFEEGFRVVRAFVQRIESGAVGPLEARLGADLRSLGEGAATALIRVATPGALAALAADGSPREPGRTPPAPRIRLILGQPPVRFSQERLAAAYHGTAWALGREAASLLPIDALAGAAIRAPWSWQAAALRRSLESAAPLLARDGRAVLLLESGGPEALVAAILGGVGAGYRVADARLADVDEDGGGIVELVPPGAAMPPGPRARSGRQLDAVPGGPGDPELVPGPGLFAPPERIDARPFSHAEATRTITELAVEVLRERGEPARYERLLGEILVGLDRAGHLRRLVTAADDELDAGHDAGHDAVDDAGHDGAQDASPPDSAPASERLLGTDGSSARGEVRRPGDGPAAGSGSPSEGPVRDSVRSRSPRAPRPAVDGAGPAAGGHAAAGDAARPPTPDTVDRVLALVHDELTRPTQRRLTEIEAGRWWLGDRRDIQGAAVPLADRVEWAAYSLLSTAGPLDETAFYERISGLFSGHDLPDESLVRACLASYRSPASTPDRLVTGEDVRRRTAEHTELLASLTDGGHRLGMTVWIGRREQARRFGAGTLGDLLDPREQSAWLPSIARASAEDLEDVDCIWYVRGRTALLFEVEWTAMLGDTVLRRHARIPGDERLVRFLVVASERAELLRHKLEASPVLREAMERGNWHVVQWPHLRAWLATEPFALDGLEPYLGLEPAVERRGRQLGLFDPPDALR
jgi:hypothetical protein